MRAAARNNFCLRRANFVRGPMHRSLLQAFLADFPGLPVTRSVSAACRALPRRFKLQFDGEPLQRAHRRNRWRANRVPVGEQMPFAGEDQIRAAEFFGAGLLSGLLHVAGFLTIRICAIFIHDTPHCTRYEQQLTTKSLARCHSEARIVFAQKRGCARQRPGTLSESGLI